jgi:sulfate transport system permease protein
MLGVARSSRRCWSSSRRLSRIGIDGYTAAIGASGHATRDPAHRPTALIAVPVNTAFGIAAAWAITKFDFWGKRFLLIVIEIPFSISPIVAGVAYLFVYGLQGLFGPRWTAD